LYAHLSKEGRGGDDKDGNHRGDRNDDRQRNSAAPARIALPKGTPSWFSEKDLDADGQVAMAEYSTAWTDTEGEAFLRNDLNNDGVITPHEAIEAANPAAASTAGAGSARPSAKPTEAGRSSVARTGEDRERREGFGRRRGGGRWSD
jgi:hypothetical protein